MQMQLLLALVGLFLGGAAVQAFVLPSAAAPSSALASTALRMSTSATPLRPMPNFLPGDEPSQLTQGDFEGQYPAVKRIEGLEQMTEALASHQDKLVVVKFIDQFCAACKSVNPRWRQLAHEYKGSAAFYEVEFSTNKALCRSFGIKRLPTVQAFMGASGKVIDTPVGPKRFHLAEKEIAEIIASKGESVASISVPQ
jgi:thioredoxin 1